MHSPDKSISLNLHKDHSAPRCAIDTTFICSYTIVIKKITDRSEREEAFLDGYECFTLTLLISTETSLHVLYCTFEYLQGTRPKQPGRACTD